MTKNKNILIVTECFFPEEFKINDIALLWKDKGFNVDVLTLNPTYPFGKVFPGYKNSFFRKDKYQDLDVYRLRAVTGYKSSLVKKIFKYINFMIFGSVAAIFIGRKYDYVFGFNTSSLTNMIPAVLIRKLYKKPTMFWVQDVWPDSVYAYGFKKTKFISVLLDAFVRFMYQNIDKIALSSKGFEVKLLPYVKKGMSFHYLPNWADDLDNDLQSKDLGGGNEKVHFTFAGNVGQVQNLENVIYAFSSMEETYQQKTQLNIIGDGSKLEDLMEIAESRSNIVFHGQKQREQMSSYYKASDFLIISLADHPIFSVTVPSKLQTYIAAKKPILAFINGDVADIVREHNLGLCVNPSKIHDISMIFRRCVDMSKTERDKFVSNNDSLLNTIFNKKKTINKLLNILLSSEIK